MNVFAIVRLALWRGLNKQVSEHVQQSQDTRVVRHRAGFELALRGGAGGPEAINSSTRGNYAAAVQRVESKKHTESCTYIWLSTPARTPRRLWVTPTNSKRSAKPATGSSKRCSYDAI